MQNQRQEWAVERPLVQHHVEFLQALIPQHHLSAFATRPALPADLEAIHDLVHDCTQTYGRRCQADLSVCGNAGSGDDSAAPRPRDTQNDADLREVERPAPAGDHRPLVVRGADVACRVGRGVTRV